MATLVTAAVSGFNSDGLQEYVLAMGTDRKYELREVLPGNPLGRLDVGLVDELVTGFNEPSILADVNGDALDDVLGGSVENFVPGPNFLTILINQGGSFSDAPGAIVRR